MGSIRQIPWRDTVAALPPGRPFMPPRSDRLKAVPLRQETPAQPIALPTLGAAIRRVLAFRGGDRIYGVGGDYAANLIRALESDCTLLPSSNEMHAGFSACAHAELTGFAVCLVTYTVGSLPCMSAAALAKAEGLPVLFISGAPGENESGALHHMVQSAHAWTVDDGAALRAFAALGLRAERLTGSRPGVASIAAERFAELVDHAMRCKEPVFVEVPRDLLQTEVLMPSLADRPETVDPAGGLAQAKAIAAALRRARRPVVFFGERLKFNQALQQAILAFCTAHRIPFAANIFAKGLLDDFHELSLGAYNGAFSIDSCRRYIDQEADYVLELCTSILPQDSSSAFDTGTYGIDGFANRTTMKGALPDCGDVLAMMRHLAGEELPRFDYAPPHRPLPPLAADEPMGFNNLVAVLDSLQADEPRACVYIPEVGNSFFASLTLRTRRAEIGRSWLTNPWYAAMGTSLPYARAVCRSIQAAGASDVPIVLTGDGGFHFQLNELIHFLREGHFLVILLLRNDIFHLGKTSDCPIYQCSDGRFDFRQLIQAYGGTHWSCPTVGEFMAHFRRCLSQRQGIHLLEIPAGTGDGALCQEVRLLNAYIHAKSGGLPGAPPPAVRHA
jgi:thiamine pyrophosphate-dependent acetolactate synthase large subunit-like protein